MRSILSFCLVVSCLLTCGGAFAADDSNLESTKLRPVLVGFRNNLHSGKVYRSASEFLSDPSIPRRISYLLQVEDDFESQAKKCKKVAKRLGGIEGINAIQLPTSKQTWFSIDFDFNVCSRQWIIDQIKDERLDISHLKEKSLAAKVLVAN